MTIIVEMKVRCKLQIMCHGTESYQGFPGSNITLLFNIWGIVVNFTYGIESQTLQLCRLKWIHPTQLATWKSFDNISVGQAIRPNVLWPSYGLWPIQHLHRSIPGQSLKYFEVYIINF